MVDTLKRAEGLQEGEDGFPPAQARKLARAIAEASDDKRLRDLEVKVNGQAILTGLMLAAMVALFWQLLALRGEVSAGLPGWTSASLASSARPNCGSMP